MAEMMVRVARAIYEGRNGRGCKPWSLLTKAHKEPYLKDARAAIEAMREPTEGMVDAMYANGAEGDPEQVSSDFTAAIDAALSVGDEHPKGRDLGLGAEPASASDAQIPPDREGSKTAGKPLRIIRGG